MAKKCDNKGNGDAIRVLLVDDHSAVRDGIREFLDEHKHINVVGESAGGEEAIRQVVKLNPDIVVLDVSMPRVSGMDVAKQLQRLAPDAKVLALSVYEDDHVAGMVRCGATAYVTKSAPPSDLLEAIEAVHRGDTFFSEPAARVLLEDYVKHADVIGEASRLSRREEEVLGQIVEGLTNKEIGERFGISRRTVETHRLNIRKKLGLETTADLIKYAVMNGMVPASSEAVSS